MPTPWECVTGYLRVVESSSAGQQDWGSAGARSPLRPLQPGPSLGANRVPPALWSPRYNHSWGAHVYCTLAPAREPTGPPGSMSTQGAGPVTASGPLHSPREDNGRR